MALNVLLLEDDPTKKARLLSFLNDNKELFENVDTTICVKDALKNLQAHKYDLFIVDIVVPYDLGGENHEKNCISLMEQLDDGYENLTKPTYCLPISSSKELSEDAYEFFRGRPWQILPYSETNKEFLISIEKIANFILLDKVQVPPVPCCDIFLITALMEPEFEAIEELGFAWEPLEPLDAYQLIRFGKVALGDSEYRIGAAFCSRMGPVDAGILTVKAITKLNPKIVIMAGICAGIPNKSKIGDVISPDISWDWQSGKYIDKNGKEAFQIAPHQLDVDEQSKNQLLLLKRDTTFWNSLAPLAVKEKVDVPRLLVGPMASGSSVLGDARVVDRIKTHQHKNVIGLDMETYAVFAASRACNPNIKVLSLKSVCDMGDLKKNEIHQLYASKISASAVYQFITHYCLPLF